MTHLLRADHLKRTKPEKTFTDLEEQLDIAWKDYSLDAPKLLNPIPHGTQGLRRICVITHLAIPVAKIIIGSRYANDCPMNDWLPKYMIVGGLLQLGFLMVLLYRPWRKPPLLGVMGFAVLIWILISSINIFVEWKPDFFFGGWRYCHKALFYFAFFVSVSEYIIIAVLLLYVCTQFAYDRNPSTQVV